MCVNTLYALYFSTIINEATKKKVFNRGGPVWPPGSNAKDDRTAPKKIAFDEAASFCFGRLDQMLRTIVQGGGGSRGGFAPPAKNG